MLAIYLAVGALAAACTVEANTQDCTENMCEKLGSTDDTEICTSCKTGKVPINGRCAEAASSNTKCKNAAGTGDANQVCGKCLSTTFMYKGGCYETTKAPGNIMCQTAAEGVCTAAVTTKEYSTIPAADRDPTKPSVVACGDTVGVTVNGKTYTGVDGCTKCTEPESLSTVGTKAATCEACSAQESTPRIVKTAAGVTSCVTEEGCTGTEGFFVKDGTPKTCVACNENCKTCSSAAEQCISCNANTPYLKKADNGQTGTCVNAADCTNGNTYYADDTVDPTSGKLCRKCAEGGVTVCTTCEKIESGVVCKECTGETAIFGLNKKSCVSQCPENSSKQIDACVCNNGFTPNAGSSACVAASSCKTPHCQTCTGEGQEGETCTACATGYYLTPTGQCVDSCGKLGSYYKDGNNVCKPCSPECASCTAVGNNKCLSCPAGKVLKYTSESDISGGGSCVDECKANTGGCETCGAVIGGSRYCSKCGDANQAPLNGNCAANARTAFCDTITAGACTQCANGYFLLDGGCYETSRQPGKSVCTTESGGKCTQCANGMTVNSQTGVCPSCDPSCKTCGVAAASECASCFSGYYLDSTAKVCKKCSETSGTITGIRDSISCASLTGNYKVIMCCSKIDNSTSDTRGDGVGKSAFSISVVTSVFVLPAFSIGGLAEFLVSGQPITIAGRYLLRETDPSTVYKPASLCDAPT
ncbi:Variant-specific surface protein [Giardia duodenalis]|uniref:Variant-specific surface protein n=1 Tax=Giardia intestinalis TaxID=5741 RepID=V6TNY1_GIAIN|nr:Variant-specific surface protein [Giardia intestinalis]